jgi:hypothetical protein
MTNSETSATRGTIIALSETGAIGGALGNKIERDTDNCVDR